MATRWKKSSRSNGNGGNCVEVHLTPVRVMIRDSKNVAGPILQFDRAAWVDLLLHVKGDQLDR
ncbi:DUF397 domain-containing protein [Umezawaea beigongshangensis]|uniref:DUF397 domain-containing protein n=1 Tax=Umezawaea beigongshangensis TaxID=2780383 RepID=UPI0018F17C38|nr:DUF397 domain-containing protein [Umezawaea beigongshangensis]